MKHYYTKTVKPKIEKEKFLDGTIRDCVVVDIFGKEYELCEDVAKIYWSHGKSSAFGVGMISTPEDPYRTERVGVLGEAAFSKISGLPMDVSRINYGDEQDYVINKKHKVDVKCASRNNGVNLVRCVTSGGFEKPMDKDIYIMSYMKRENRQEKKATISIVGFHTNKTLKQCPVEPGLRPSRHMNYESYFEDTKPIVPFLEMCKKKFGLGI